MLSALVLQPAKRTPPNISRSKNSNTQRTENKTTDVVIQQHSSRLLKMDILVSETCWAHNKWNKIASDIKLVFSSLNYQVYIHFSSDSLRSRGKLLYSYINAYQRPAGVGGSNYDFVYYNFPYKKFGQFPLTGWHTPSAFHKTPATECNTLPS